LLEFWGVIIREIRTEEFEYIIVRTPGELYSLCVHAHRERHAVMSISEITEDVDAKIPYYIIDRENDI